MMNLFKIFGLGTFLLVASIAQAGLVWESKEVSQVVAVGADRAVAEFKFENQGDAAVTITEVKTSCGCTATKLSKKTYQPGETGSIEAVLDIGDRNGIQRKTVRVYTDKLPDPAILTMKTEIPVVLQVSPRFLFWKEGTGYKSKFVDFRVGVDELVNIVNVQSSSDGFETELQVIEAGKHYRLKVVPISEGKMRSVITIETDFPKDNPKRYKLSVHVR